MGRDFFAVYYGEDLYDDEVDDEVADRIDSTLTHLFLGGFEAAAWLVRKHERIAFDATERS